MSTVIHTHRLQTVTGLNKDLHKMHDAGNFISTLIQKVLICDLDSFWVAHVLHKEITS